jgi:type I restriction enzyme M protein
VTEQVLEPKRARLREQGKDPATLEPGEGIAQAIEDAALGYRVFLAEASQVGYAPTGIPSPQNDLYRRGNNGALNPDQSQTILGEWRTFVRDPNAYAGSTLPDCMSIPFGDLWQAHDSHRLDPKYHLFQREAARPLPPGWVRERIGNLMRRRDVPVEQFDADHIYTVLTISQTGEIRPRAAGKGNNPPSWVGEYFEMVSRGDWFAAQANDVVFSSIDLWKGCISVVPQPFQGGLVTKEFPIYEITDARLAPEFLQTLLRSRYYQRAFRAITTGHSNRRRTQVPDFEAVEIAFPADPAEQQRLIASITAARNGLRQAAENLRGALLSFSDLIDGRGEEELPEVNGDVVEPGEE